MDEQQKLQQEKLRQANAEINACQKALQSLTVHTNDDYIRRRAREISGNCATLDEARRYLGQLRADCAHIIAATGNGDIYRHREAITNMLEAL